MDIDCLLFLSINFVVSSVNLKFFLEQFCLPNHKQNLEAEQPLRKM